ncbi:tRNA (N(6)-L-threonylcarbamoyladenosine(37)-C(2))-methylthiotransferase MtaB [Kaistia nematophila]|uniref:tRNA (N(6)-L-threonylcarbamoyladenosine(37)-C(2))-methylthiotransferase MtaB n=1 Tax=Kaistia nematophila TaxID=2994654 RepID=A0A9X3E5S7_9HYPH|nr:tRNA (N(6)-L-threonylcarbamoyladenosine(37)-C(2))-methylthiotransferase MtaB [Kaistia nematophila]MCX5570103.1 tRNA (N(6)-L-threonylcarbamoyladenosine(37)-C(2))-methylthiotransferase MtaB [Kaistia nematophila]
MTIETITFGCRLNTLETEVMRNRAAEAGLADAVIINTCAVTAEAVRQARQTIRRTRRERPDVKIVVSGCAAQTESATFAAMEEVDLVLGNAEKLTSAAYRPLGLQITDHERVQVADIMAVRETAGHLVAGMDGHTRGFVQVQNGCDHRCTFCIIPYGRGPSRSVPMGAVVEQIRRLVETGHAEIVLTGVDMTAYGSDLPGRPTLGTLVATILKLVPELPRLRLSSIDTIEVDDALMRAIGEDERLMPHFHLSLQHGDDLILKRMKRRHGRADAIRFAEAVRRLRPDVVLGADIIAGFPTESEAMFENSLALVDDCGLTHLHVFPFSPRPGTPAARMPQLDPQTIKARAARLREKGQATLAAHLDGEIGATRHVLMEKGGVGRTEHFTPVSMPGIAAGTLVPAHIVGRTASGLLATPLAEAA